MNESVFDREAIAHMVGNCILNGGNIKDDMEWFWETLHNIEKIAQYRLEHEEWLQEVLK